MKQSIEATLLELEDQNSTLSRSLSLADPDFVYELYQNYTVDFGKYMKALFEGESEMDVNNAGDDYTSASYADFQHSGRTLEEEVNFANDICSQSTE